MKQTVYIPTKVKNELPPLLNGDIEDNVFAISNSKSLFVAETIRVNGKLQDEHDYPSYAEYWLKPKEVYVFTPEELKPLQDIVNEGYDAHDENQHLVVQRWLNVIENFLNKEK